MSSVNRISQISQRGNILKQDHIPMDHTPRKFVLHPQNSLVYLIESENRTYSGEASEQRLAQLVRDCAACVIANYAEPLICSGQSTGHSIKIYWSFRQASLVVQRRLRVYGRLLSVSSTRWRYAMLTAHKRLRPFPLIGYTCLGEDSSYSTARQQRGSVLASDSAICCSC